MIIDAFPFLNELSILEFRLKLLWDHVDKFVIVESNRTFSGAPKPFNFPANYERFAWAMEKIIYHPVNLSIKGMNLVDKPVDYNPSDDYWKLENRQREAIIPACAELPDDAILIISDCDEIPSFEAINAFDPEYGILSCKQELFYYNLKYRRNIDWRGSVITNLGDARKIGAQWFRDKRNKMRAISPGGWHLSYFNDQEHIKYKIQSFAHQEYNAPEFTDTAHIAECIATGADLYNRGTAVTKVDARDFPPYFVELAKQYNWGLE